MELRWPAKMTMVLNVCGIDEEREKAGWGHGLQKLMV